MKNSEQLQSELRNRAREALQTGEVQLVIGYGLLETGSLGPIFVTRAKDADLLVFNGDCTANLVVYLTRKEITKLGKIAVVVKPRDLRSAIVLINESQITFDRVVFFGVGWSDRESLLVLDGQSDSDTISAAIAAELPPDSYQQDRDARLAQIRAMPLEERLAFWKEEFARCIKCYGCRQSCPLCYCNVCIVDKNRPVRIDTSATLKGNMAWNIVRAFHLGGRCVGCGACAEACPVGIELDLLNRTLSGAAQEHFNHRSGTVLGALPLIGTYSPDDKEEFIR